jgi:hypothetical protein
MQVDIGFGDVVTAGPEDVTLPLMLETLPSVTLRAYPREQTVAEKFEAMVELDVRNSRMKDFHDLWVLAGVFPFDGARLRDAVAGCFARRGTPWSDEPPAVLTASFYGRAEMQARWFGYVRGGTVQDVPPSDFAAIGERLVAFLGPVHDAMETNTPLRARWAPGGTWEPHDEDAAR